MSPLTLDEIKVRWNEVLDGVLVEDRISWLAFFDARLVSFENGVLTIDFKDVKKLAGDHDFSIARNPKHLTMLHMQILRVFGAEIRIEEV